MSQALVLFNPTPSSCSDTEMEEGHDAVASAQLIADASGVCLPTSIDEFDVQTNVV
jgi:hypothetical protein